MEPSTSAWKGEISCDMLNQLNANTLGEAMEIKFTEVGDDFLVATMPVNHKTKQPFGSVASWCAVNRELFIGVGVEINANHIAQVTEGMVTAVCKPVKLGGKIHIWEIRISDDNGALCCISRFTCMIVPKPKP